MKTVDSMPLHTLFKHNEALHMRVPTAHAQWLVERQLIDGMIRNRTEFPMDVLSFDQNFQRPGLNGLHAHDGAREMLVKAIPLWACQQANKILGHLQAGGWLCTSSRVDPNAASPGIFVRDVDSGGVYMKITKSQAITLQLSSCHADSWYNHFISLTYVGHRFRAFGKNESIKSVSSNELTPNESSNMQAIRVKLGEVPKAKIAKDMAVNTCITDKLYADRKEAARKAAVIIGTKPDPVPVNYRVEGDRLLEKRRQTNIQELINAMSTVSLVNRELKRFGYPLEWEPAEIEAILKAAQPFFNRAGRVSVKKEEE